MSDVVIIHKKSGSLPMEVEKRHLEMIEQAVSGRVYHFETEQQALESKADAEVLFTWCGSGEIPEEYILSSKKIRWVNSFSAGVNAIMGTPCANLPIKLTNAKGIHGRAMSVTTIGYIISFLRGFPQLQRQQQQHIWKKPDMLPREPYGLTLGIIGAGAIAGELAGLAKTMGMTVLGVKRKVVPIENFDKVFSSEDMDEVLTLSDFVVVLTPLTENTYHMIGDKELAKMKSGAVLINISRGPVIDEKALISALEQDVIAGAALDATETEPLAADSPLWDMENVIITPHCSADSNLYMDRAIEQFCKNLRRYENGEALFNEIDMERKY